MDRKEYIKGLLYGFGAFILWGLMPLYWKALKEISPYQIFSHRVFWSFFFVMGLLIYKGQLKAFIKSLQDRQTLVSNILPTLFISVNWLVYIWSVNNNYVIEASLGYYLNPLVLTLFGYLFYKESLSKIQLIGIAFAVFGVLLKTITYGKLPIISLILAVSFAVYGLLKKKSKYTSIHGLGYETLIVGLPCLGYLLFNESTGQGISGNLPWHFWLLIAISGIATALPLIWYAEGTKRLPLSVIAFLQYIAPTIGLFLGVVVFKEAFKAVDIIPFLFIWIGLGFFTYSQLKLLKSR